MTLKNGLGVSFKGTKEHSASSETRLKYFHYSMASSILLQNFMDNGSLKQVKEVGAIELGDVPEIMYLEQTRIMGINSTSHDDLLK